MTYKDPDKQREYNRLWRRKRRIADRDNAFRILGEKCVWCGNGDYRVLHIDHIEPVLRNEQERRARSGAGLRQRVANSSEDISNLQLLCANCHQIKTFDERKKYSNYIS